LSTFGWAGRRDLISRTSMPTAMIVETMPPTSAGKALTAMSYDMPKGAAASSRLRRRSVSP
jgi:hypothetical protein